MTIRRGQDLACPFLIIATCVATTAAAPPSQAGNSGIEVVVKTIAPEAIRGRLVGLSLSDGATLHSDSEGLTRIPTPDLVRITTTVTEATRRPRDVIVSLTGGDVLYGLVVDDDGDGVAVETADLGRLLVPLDAVKRLDTARAASASYREYLKWFDQRPAGDQDRILLTNGDVVDGFVTALGVKGVSIEGEMGEALVPFRLVVALRLASPPPVPFQQPYMVLGLRSSGRLTVTDLIWSGDIVEARLRHGGSVRIEPERITGVDVVGGRWEWLGQHQPISFEHTPMLSLDWEYAADHNVVGGPIAVAGRMYEHGIGVHSRSSLTYDLKGDYHEFVTHFGIDDDSGPLADVSVFVLVDGKRRFARDHVCRGELFGPVRLDVKGAKRIRLIVDFGDNGELQDRFDWVETALVR